jgi:hypothetical protein
LRPVLGVRSSGRPVSSEVDAGPDTGVDHVLLDLGGALGGADDRGASSPAAADMMFGSTLPSSSTSGVLTAPMTPLRPPGQSGTAVWGSLTEHVFGGQGGRRSTRSILLTGSGLAACSTWLAWAGSPGWTGPIRYGRIISLSSCSTM